MPALQTRPAARLVLRANTAGDLMALNPVSVRRQATVREAIVLMANRGINAAPVIDDNGRPIGVISISDILIHDHEYSRFLQVGYETAAGSELARSVVAAEEDDTTTVEELMTPAVFTVSPETPAAHVVRELLALKVHHLFVADHEGTLVGVISASDILRQLE